VGKTTIVRLREGVVAEPDIGYSQVAKRWTLRILRPGCNAPNLRRTFCERLATNGGRESNKTLAGEHCVATADLRDYEAYL